MTIFQAFLLLLNLFLNKTIDYKFVILYTIVI